MKSLGNSMSLRGIICECADGPLALLDGLLARLFTLKLLLMLSVVTILALMLLVLSDLSFRLLLVLFPLVRPTLVGWLVVMPVLAWELLLRILLLPFVMFDG